MEKWTLPKFTLMSERAIKRMMRERADDADVSGLVLSAAFGGPAGQQAYRETTRRLRGGH